MDTIKDIVNGTTTPLTPAQEALTQAHVAKEGYIHRVLVAFDQACNVIFFKGQPGETISTHAARAWRTEHKLWAHLLMSFLNLCQKNHGADARAGDIQRAQNLLRIENAWLENKAA